MIWNTPRLWEGGDCWIIGGGPSIWDQFQIPRDVIQAVVQGSATYANFSPYLSPIHDRHVIGVNNAYLLGPWIDFVFFGDCGYYLAHRNRLKTYSGIKVTCCPRFANKRKEESECIHYLAKDRSRSKGISRNPSKVSWNNNSGAAAISLAVHLGCRRIFLLGFDMTLAQNGTYSHWHGSHQIPGRIKKIKSPPFQRHLLGFPQIAKDAEELGIQIFNASPNSRIQDFPKITLQEALVLCDSR